MLSWFVKWMSLPSRLINDRKVPSYIWLINVKFPSPRASSWDLVTRIWSPWVLSAPSRTRPSGMSRPSRGTVTSRTSTSWRCTRCTLSLAVYSSVRWGWVRPRHWVAALPGSTLARTPTCVTPGRPSCSSQLSWTEEQVGFITILTGSQISISTGPAINPYHPPYTIIPVCV